MGLWDHSTNPTAKGSILPQKLQRRRKIREFLPWGGNWECRALTAPLGRFSGCDKDTLRHLGQELLLKAEQGQVWDPGGWIKTNNEVKIPGSSSRLSSWNNPTVPWKTAPKLRLKSDLLLHPHSQTAISGALELFSLPFPPLIWWFLWYLKRLELFLLKHLFNCNNWS